MKILVGIRREDKNKWEARVPILPETVREMQKNGVQFVVQPSPIRIFSDEEFAQKGAIIQEDLSACPFVIAIKEIPINFFQEGKTYLFFSHTIKGQAYNMPMLKKMLELNCTLIDYEKITDEHNRRLIFFGRHAGLAGMIDTLWALGQRLKWEGTETPFARVKQAYQYSSLEEAKKEIAQIGKEIKENGLPEMLAPLTYGFIGYGNVSAGAQEIFDLLPFVQVKPFELQDLPKKSVNTLYKVVFKEEDLATPVSPETTFQLQDYYQNPEKYEGCFQSFVPYLTVIVNCAYWEDKYPRFITKDFLQKLYQENDNPKLKVIGDISCDIEGGIEANVKLTTPDSPVFVYQPADGQVFDGVEGTGPVILSIDNLPCEIAREASAFFDNIIKDFITPIIKADFSGSFTECVLPDPIKRAVIAFRGELTPSYQYLKKYL